MIVQKYTFLANLQKVYSLVFVRHNKMKLYVQVSGFLRDAFGFCTFIPCYSTKNGGIPTEGRMPPRFYAFRASSDALFYVPHKCSQTEHRVVLVELTQTLKNRFYQIILNNSKDGIVH